MKFVANTLIQKTMIKLMREQPFYASILLSLEIEENPSKTKTIAVNGKNIFYNPIWIEGKSIESMKCILVHEAMHLAFGHHIRLGKKLQLIQMGNRQALIGTKDRIHKLANEAGDLAINELLKKEFDIPKEVKCIIGKGEYTDFKPEMNAEYYYDELEKRSEQEQEKNSPENDESRNDNGQDDNADPNSSERSKLHGNNSEQSKDNISQSCNNDKNNNNGEAKKSNDISGDNSSKNDDGKGSCNESDSRNDGSSSNDNINKNCGYKTTLSQDETLQSSELSERNPDQQIYGEFSACRGNSLEEISAEEHKWERQIAVSMAEAKEAGKMPGFIAEAIMEEFGVSQVPWEQALRPYLTELGSAGYNYSKPNRRRGQSSIIFPDNHSLAAVKLIIGLDTSGSMSQAEMLKLFPELENAIRSFPEMVIEIVMFDTRITSNQEFGINDLPIRKDKWEFKGRGGTSYKPFFDHCDKKNPRLVITLTDGYPCDSFPVNKSYGMIWLMTRDIKAPEGINIKV